MGALKPWLEDASMHKVGHNILGFDSHMFANHGVKLGGVIADTMRMHQLLDNRWDATHKLKDLMWWWLGYKLGSFKELFSRPKRLIDAEIEDKDTYRKVDGQKVPTLFCEGTVGRFSPKGKELIPLDTVATDYPELLNLLYDYSTLDAKATLELYYLLKAKLEEAPCLPFT